MKKIYSETKCFCRHHFRKHIVLDEISARKTIFCPFCRAVCWYRPSEIRRLVQETLAESE